MNVSPLDIADVLLVEPRVFGDARGYFFESYHQQRYAEVGIGAPFVQDNVSFSTRGTLRGLHAQHPNDQGKLVSVLMGEVFDVAVDVRRGSPSFGKWVGATLSAENKAQLWVPPGFLHGFCVVSEQAVFAYKCTAFYSPGDELGVRYDDPALGIQWPVDEPLLSDRDRGHPLLSEIPEARLPGHG